MPAAIAVTVQLCTMPCCFLLQALYYYFFGGFAVLLP
jgi:hypothetical protein